MKLKTGNIVIIDEEKYIIIENPYIQDELCHLDACFAALDGDGRLKKFINTQEELDEILQYEILPGIAEELKH